MQNPSSKIHCPSCGRTFTGRFCSHCGEQRLDPQLRTFSHIFSEWLASITSVDGKLISSLRLLLFKPGQLDCHWHEGSRVNFMRPIALFLLINVLFAMFNTLTDFYVTLANQLGGQMYSPYVVDWINGQVAQSGLTQAEFAKKYNDMAKVVARSIIIISVPFMAVWLPLMFKDRRWFFSDHFVFSLNFYSFLLLWIVLSKALFYPIKLIGVETGSLYFWLLPIGLLLYSFLASKRLYQQSVGRILFKVPLVLLAFFFSHMAYRFVQLFLVIWLI